jgi:hypothetical protein
MADTVITTKGAKHSKMPLNKSGQAMANAAEKTKTIVTHGQGDKTTAKGAESKGAKSKHLKNVSTAV